MKLPHHLTVRKGHLHIAGQDCVSLAEKYGTPLYVTSEDRVVEQFESYRKALGTRYPKVQVLFAAKANGNLALMRALAEKGVGADVFSSGELQLALEAGAYGYAMSSQYNSHPRCPELLLHGSQAALIRRSETVSDITVAMERPPWQI